MAQYTVLEELGVLPKEEIDRYCTADGLLGAHPDYGVPGIEASTGSLGHGMAMAVGMAIAERNRAGSDGNSGVIYTVISDGELQEGSTWEALLMGSSFNLNNLVVVIDNNDFQSLGRTSETHPTFYPLVDKLVAFGWEVEEATGHDATAIFEKITNRGHSSPFCLVATTIKGRGVSYMENVPIWHYRSPSPREYEDALAGLKEVSS